MIAKFLDLAETELIIPSLIYINDINEGIVSTTKLFADDTSMYLSVDDDETRSETLNLDLNKIQLWANKWKVTFNGQKTELVNICRQNAIPTNQLVFEGTIISLTNILDLSFKETVNGTIT